MYALKHADINADLYAAKVTLQQAVASPVAAAAAAPAWEGESEEEESEEEEEEEEEKEEEDNDYFSDYDDEAIVNPPTPPSDAGAPAQPSVVDWQRLGGDLHVNIDGGQRSTRSARMKLGDHVDVRVLSPGALFRLLFPPDAARSIALATSARLEKPIAVDELFGFLGVMMRCADDSRPRASLWQTSKNSAVYPNPTMGEYMPLRRFNSIATELKLSVEAENDMAAVLQLVKQWNDHMNKVYEPSGTVCLDESRAKHTSTRIPSFRYLPRKPTSTGNEYHTVCDAETRVMIKMELFRARTEDEPVPPDETDFGKMGALVLRMTKPLYGTGTAVIMDSAFCVVKAVLEMRRRGVFAATVVKPLQRYWPRHLDGIADVVATLKTKPVGELHARKGTSADQLPIAHFLVNYGKYVVQLLSTYGSDVLGDEQRRVRTDGKVISYRRNAVIDDYYRARLAVDLHNNVRQGQWRTLEETWASRKWPVRQLAFVVSATLVNTYFIYTHFSGHEPITTFNQFRRLVLLELMETEKARRNEGAEAARRPRRPSLGGEVEVSHKLVHLKLYEGASPGKRTKKKYQQQRCKGRGCGALTRTFCSCDRKLFLCLGCFATHVALSK
jgi:hypothetical protein